MLTISSAEWEVMRVLWAKGQATSSEIIAILSKKLDLLAAKEPVDQVVCDCVPGQCACGHHMEVI